MSAFALVIYSSIRCVVVLLEESIKQRIQVSLFLSNKSRSPDRHYPEMYFSIACQFNVVLKSYKNSTKFISDFKTGNPEAAVVSLKGGG